MAKLLVINFSSKPSLNKTISQLKGQVKYYLLHYSIPHKVDIETKKVQTYAWTFLYKIIYDRLIFFFRSQQLIVLFARTNN